ncbi:sentrin-specific protease 1 [Mobula hypostoma]|uniref:sentrin-specific protease 1 n=1 Tax=Mobula hypostoma TaxID=723540 RepID=UPI002FC36B30
MLKRVRSAVWRFLLGSPETREPDRKAGGEPETDSRVGSGDVGRAGRKRPRLSTQSSEEQDGRPWKRLKVGELVEAMKNRASEAWNTPSLVLRWLKSGSPSPRDLPAPSNPPSSSSGAPHHRSRRALAPTQIFSSSLGDPCICQSREPAWIPLVRPDCCQQLPREEAMFGYRDELELMNRLPHSTWDPHPVNRHSKNRLALPRTPSPSHEPGLSQFVPMYTKTFSSRGVPERPASGSHARTSRKFFSTVEESIRQEEKEIYRQLLEMVASQHTSKLRTMPFSSPLSHRGLPGFQSPRERGSPKVPILEESHGARECLAAQLAPCRLSWAEPPSGSPDVSETRFSASPVVVEETPATDTMSTGSDTESVIVVKVKEAPKRESERMPKFDAVLWIRELTSMYDSRARERRRRIEEQEALADRLRQQRLQESEILTARSPSQLRLTVPLVEEVPIADISHRELEGEERVVRAEEEQQEEEEEEQLPQLTEEMQEEVDRAFQPGNADEVLSEAFRLTITRKDIQTLNHLNWLNDEVINFYMNLLVERSLSPSLPSLHAFNTFFFPKLKSDGYTAVKRWTKRVNIFAMDVLLIPVHLGVHWCLAVVDFRKKNIFYYDSMGGSNDEACRLLLRYLKEESLDKRKVEFDVSGWVLGSKRSQDIPQQMNGSDCGMFTCKYADYISRDRPIRFSQKDMPFFRQLMAWEIIHQKLL